MIFQEIQISKKLCVRPGESPPKADDLLCGLGELCGWILIPDKILPKLTYIANWRKRTQN